MQTLSHWLFGAVGDRVLRHRGVQVQSRALLIGSVLPDAPLFALTLGFFIARYWWLPDTSDGPFPQIYDDLYFTNPWWVGLHNLFHAPIMIGLYALAGWWGKRRGAAWGAWLLWFALGCGVHSVVDIATHANDGPLLFFPFDWQTRFFSPVSYWDSDYYGREFGIFELGLNVVMIAFLVGGWLWRKRQAARLPAEAEGGKQV